MGLKPMTHEMKSGSHDQWRLCGLCVTIHLDIDQEKNSHCCCCIFRRGRELLTALLMTLRLTLSTFLRRNWQIRDEPSGAVC